MEPIVDQISLWWSVVYWLIWKMWWSSWLCWWIWWAWLPTTGWSYDHTLSWTFCSYPHLASQYTCDAMLGESTCLWSEVSCYCLPTMVARWLWPAAAEHKVGFISTRGSCILRKEECKNNCVVWFRCTLKNFSWWKLIWSSPLQHPSWTSVSHNHMNP